MDYIDFGDIQDAVLDCKYEDIVYGNEIINSLASRLQVTDIPEPVPYIVKRLGVVLPAITDACCRPAQTLRLYLTALAV